MAPEVMEGSGYGMQCDVWSAGVLLYVFMSGYLPFQGANRDEVFSKIRGGKFHFNHEEFTEVVCNQLLGKKNGSSEVQRTWSTKIAVQK